MSKTPEKCIRCHPRGPGDPPITGPAHFICDSCMEATNHPFNYLLKLNMPKRPPSSPDARPAASSDTDGRKSSKRRGRKTKAVATALVLMLLPFLGCTIHHETTFDVAFDPADVLRLVPPGPPVDLTTSGG